MIYNFKIILIIDIGWAKTKFTKMYNETMKSLGYIQTDISTIKTSVQANLNELQKASLMYSNKYNWKSNDTNQSNKSNKSINKIHKSNKINKTTPINDDSKTERKVNMDSIETKQDMLPLKVIKYREYTNNDPPTNLLKADNSLYFSGLCGDFKHNEPDYIIFLVDELSAYPEVGYILNRGWNSDVKKGQLHISKNINSNEWLLLGTFNLKKSTQMQSFQLDSFLNLDKNYKYFKLTLINNYGWNGTDLPKFVFKRFCIKKGKKL